MALDSSDPLHLFMRALRVDRSTAQVLVDEGFESLEELAYIPHWELQKVSLPPWLIADIRARAKEILMGE
jgi:N utilization substance protein A